MSDIGKAFDKRFGTTNISSHQLRHHGGKSSKGKTSTFYKQGSVQLQPMTGTQREWLKLMFSGNSNRHELICCLKNVRGRVECTDIRHIDFAPIDEYLSGCEGGKLSTVYGNMPVVADGGKLKGYQGDGFYRFSWLFTNRNPSNVCEIGVDDKSPLKFLSAKEIVSCIVQSKKNASPSNLDQLNRDDETIQNELTNSDDKVFLYELLQNANDYPCPGQKVRVEIRLDRDCLCFRHTGREFSALNVYALCSAGAGDKSDNPNAIGYKGIGFKTVFRNNSRVYLKSGEYSFWFDRDRAKSEINIKAPWRRVPIWDEVNNPDMGEFRVGFKLYPDRPELLDGKNNDGYRCILRRLFKDERVLLFIPELSDVSIQTSDDETWRISKRSSSWCVSDLAPVELPDSVKDEIDKEVKARNIPPKLKGKEKTLVTFACNLEGRRLIPVEDACLYCFLPAERARWGFPFLMNTDMIPTGPRDDVRPDLKLNQQLSRIAGEEFCKWINSLLECGKYDYDSVFELIPDFDDCVNKAEIPAVKKFLQEFKQGFESVLGRMVLPTNDGPCVLASECVFDTTGVLCKFGRSFWERVNDNRCLVSEQLWGCDSFARFVERYGDQIKINTFDFVDLRNMVSSSVAFANWIQNPMANGAFLRFLVEAGELKAFKDTPIFLDNHRNVGFASEMYFYGPEMQCADRYLGAFSNCYRCLSKDSAGLEEIKETIGSSFKPFGPRKFLVENILSQAVINDTREALKNLVVAQGFWSFIVHYRMWNGRERFAKDYKLLGELPFITENEEVCERIVGNEYSVYIADEHRDPEICRYEWFRARVRWVNSKYFDGDEGPKIKEFLTDCLFDDKKRLAGKVELHDVLGSVFDKFKESILADIRRMCSAMGVYDFLFDCVEKRCIDIQWLKERIVHWPVEDAKGALVERVGKSVWYYDERLVKLQSMGWLQGEKLVVLSQKCTEQKSLFDILGAKDFNQVGFGEFFRTVICPSFDKKCSDDDLIEFHRYMNRQVCAGQLVAKPQFDALKKIPVIGHTKDGNCRFDGCDGVSICKNPIDVPLEVSEGRLSETVKIMDPRLCGSAEMMEYWQKLGCSVLDEEAVIKQTIKAYYEWQKRADSNVPVSDEYKARHIRFLKSMIDGAVDISLLERIKLLDTNGRLAAPEDLVLSEVYEPKCHFQKYGCILNYVSECYSGELDLKKAKECLQRLGVRDEFQAKDVGCLSIESFCRYYWTEYSQFYAPTDDVIKAMKSAPSVLDRMGCVRKPSELYSTCLEYPFLTKIGDVNKVLPLCEGVRTEFYTNLDFVDLLTPSDAISFLLSDSDGVDYPFRGRALEWIAKGNLLPEDKERYRRDERAVWRNLKNGQMTHVEKLCVIKSRGANRVRSLFGNNEFVIDLSNIYESGHPIGKEVVENAFEKLGVVLADNSTLEPVPSGETADGCIKKDISVRLLILLAANGEENWAEEYAKKLTVLDDCTFNICNSIVESCAVFGRLKSEHGKFSEKDGVVYYVGGWQDKHVFLDVVKYLKKRLGLGDQYTDEDLKDAFDTDGGDRRLVEKVLSEGERFVRNDTFMQTLLKVSPGVWQAVKDKISEEEREQNSEEDTSTEEQAERPPEPSQPEDPLEKFKFEEGELDGYGSLWRNDNLSSEQMADQNRVTTYRLFNRLKAEGLEPEWWKEYDFNKSFDIHHKGGTDFRTKDGMVVHVASAFRGIAYISPFYWRGIVSGKCVVCAVFGHMRDDFMFFKSEEDLKKAMREDLAIIRIDGTDRARQVSHFFDVDAGENNWRNVLAGNTFKIYSLIRVRKDGKDSREMERAFTEPFSWTEDNAFRYEMKGDEYGWD